MKKPFKITLVIVLIMLVITAILGFIVVVSFKAEERYPFDDPLKKYPQEEKIKRIGERIKAEIKGNKGRSCIRAVLRGDESEGKAAPDMIAALETNEHNKVCFRLLDEIFDLEQEDRRRNREDYYSEEFPYRETFKNVDLASAVVDEAKRAQISQECAFVIEKISAAVSHEDACSPYIAGSGASERPEEHFHRIVQYLILESREELQQRDFGAASHSLLDGIRFSHDLYRGGTSHIFSERAHQAVELIINELEHGLNRKSPISSDALGIFMQEVGILSSTWPDRSEVLIGDIVDTVSRYLWWDEERECWRPDESRKSYFDELEALGLDSENDGCLTDIGVCGVFWRYHLISNLCEMKCLQDTSDVKCFRKMLKLSDNIDLWQQWREYSDWIAFPLIIELEGDTAFFELVERDLRDDISGPILDTLADRICNRFRLQALFVLAAYRTEVERTGTCPGKEFFESQEEEKMFDPASEEKMRVERVGEGKYVLRPGFQPRKGLPLWKIPAIFVDCPLEKLPGDRARGSGSQTVGDTDIVSPRAGRLQSFLPDRR